MMMRVQEKRLLVRQEGDAENISDSSDIGHKEDNNRNVSGGTCRYRRRPKRIGPLFGRRTMHALRALARVQWEIGAEVNAAAAKGRWYVKALGELYWYSLAKPFRSETDSKAERERVAASVVPNKRKNKRNIINDELNA